MADPTVLAALALDAALGWPAMIHARFGHPVGAFARFIHWSEKRWNRPGGNEGKRRLAGTATIAALAAGTATASWCIEAAAKALAGPMAWAIIALAAWPALAQRSLYQHYRPVLLALENGDLAAGRKAVSLIVGRDTEELAEAGTSRAAIESLAESFCDGVVAPLFWFIAGGLPGIWMFKAVSTADSLIGHPEPPLRAFGWAAARTDDWMNLIPARLAGALLCLAGAGGWKVLWRDHGSHSSPNSGWPEAAMAGTLGISLGGPASYDGVWQDKPWIGQGPAPSAQAMRQAARVYLRACLLLWLIAGGIAWLA